MSILSDTQITKLCVIPEMVFDQKLYDKLCDEAEQQPITLAYVSAEERRRRAAARIEKAIAAANRQTTDAEKAAFVPMIAPFSPQQVRTVKTPGYGLREMIDRKIISHGVTSYGYDVTLSDEFKVFSNLNAGVINPKKFDAESHLIDAKLMTDDEGARYVILPPNSYLLGRTNEYFRMPRDVLAVALGKSTYARVGVSVNVTPIEPGFEGQVVIEIANHTPSPIMIFANEGISQFLFFQGTEPCKVSYGDRDGKYQGQTGITIAKV